MAEISYENKIERLNVIADILENEKPELEKAVTLYEEGMTLIRSCEKELDAAQKKVMLLNGDDTLSPFEE